MLAAGSGNNVDRHPLQQLALLFRHHSLPLLDLLPKWQPPKPNPYTPLSLLTFLRVQVPSGRLW